MTPTGRFTTRFDPTHRKHYVAVAAGSGITPVLSLVATALQVEPESRFTLLYGNRTTKSIMFLEELEDLKNTIRSDSISSTCSLARSLTSSSSTVGSTVTGWRGS